MSRCFHRGMLYNNVTFLCEGLFDNLINLYVPWVNTRLSSEYTTFERLPLKSREISVAEILGLICALYKVISQFYIAHTYCATTVHIKERGFLLTNKCGDQKCLFFLGIKEILFLDKKYKPIFNVGKIKILAGTQNIIVLKNKNFMAIYKELLLLNKL